jgi:hypothetical protein
VALDRDAEFSLYEALFRLARLRRRSLRLAPSRAISPSRLRVVTEELDEFLRKTIEELRAGTRRPPSNASGVEMTAKVLGLSKLLDGSFKRINDAADAAVKRLLAAEEANLGPVRKIHVVAGELEDNAKRSNQQVDDMLNRMSNGGPPLDETTESEKSSDASDQASNDTKGAGGTEAERPLGQS